LKRMVNAINIPDDPGKVADAAIAADIAAGDAGSGGGAFGDRHIAEPESRAAQTPDQDREFIPGVMADVAIADEAEAGDAGNGSHA